MRQVPALCSHKNTGKKFKELSRRVLLTLPFFYPIYIILAH